MLILGLMQLANVLYVQTRFGIYNPFGKSLCVPLQNPRVHPLKIILAAPMDMHYTLYNWHEI